MTICNKINGGNYILQYQKCQDREEDFLKSGHQSHKRPWKRWWGTKEGKVSPVSRENVTVHIWRLHLYCLVAVTRPLEQSMNVTWLMIIIIIIIRGVRVYECYISQAPVNVGEQNQWEALL